MANAKRSLNPFRVLGTHRNFRLFWVGQTLSLVGSWMQTMAVGWLSLQLSDSAFVVGLVASVGALPVLLLSMHAGALVDRSDRLRIVRVTQAVLLVQALALWLFTWTDHLTIGILMLLSFVQGLCSAVEIPARQAMIVQLVGRDDLQPAIALNSSGFNLARVIGPAIGGIVINRLGIAWCFGLNALSFLAVLWGLWRIRVPPAAPQPPRAFLALWHDCTAGAIDGLRHLLQPGAVRDLLGLVAAGALLGAPFLTIMPVFARDLLHMGAGGYGALLTSVGVGGLVGALVMAGPGTHWPARKVLVTASAGFPVALFAFAFSRSSPVAYTILFLSGALMIACNALLNSMLQAMVPEQYRGRLMAFYSLIFVGLAQVAGSFAVGALTSAIGARAAIAACAVTLLLACVALLTRPNLVRAPLATRPQ